MSFIQYVGNPWVQTNGHLITCFLQTLMFYTYFIPYLGGFKQDFVDKNGKKMQLITFRQTYATAPPPLTFRWRRRRLYDGSVLCTAAGHDGVTPAPFSWRVVQLSRFFNAVDNFNLQCKHQQIIKMSSNEPTCFYIN